MVFSSATFLFRFLPIVAILYFIIPQKNIKLKNALLLIASLFFYFWGEHLGLLIMLGSIATNYVFGLLCFTARNNSKNGLARFYLILGVAINLSILSYFKYRGFFQSIYNGIKNGNFELINIIMPIGISFFTFQGMSYLIDCYRKECTAEKNPLKVATYISLFPQLVAGPIVLYADVSNELDSRTTTLENVANGSKRFIWGLGKKMLIANPLGEAATAIFAQSGHSTPALAWIGAISYTLQIFFDFCGYSDMAIGLGEIFGFRFPENFDYPYLATSVTSFWQKWHITLSRWFKNYVYIPLGGNRKGKARQVLNILIVWTLTGMWHGAGWNFIFWGFYFAILLIIDKFIISPLKIPKPITWFLTIICVIFGWVIFNSNTLSSGFEYIKSMFIPGEPVSTNGALYYLLEYKFEFLAGIILCTPIIKKLSDRYSNKSYAKLIKGIACLCILFLSLLSVIGTSFNPFIYFKF